MAKQSGLHQIRGKVGEHSYYKQTGVSAGLIRAINQGLSARVKTSAEYANTRLNNIEFAGACQVAAILGQLVVPKFRPMILPFSQSKMSKQVLEVARQSNLAWGRRCVQAGDTAALCEILTSTSKRNADEFIEFTVTAGSVEGEAVITYSYTSADYSLMKSLGIDKFEYAVYQYNVATGKYDSTGKIHRSYFRNPLTLTDIQTLNPEGYTEDSTEVVSAFSPTPETFNGHQLWVIVIMPIRTVGGTDHVMQEYCSFKAVPMPEGAV